MPIQTTATDASKAIATIFRWVVALAWPIDEFMA
jgi:hypothetical protein